MWPILVNVLERNVEVRLASSAPVVLWRCPQHMYNVASSPALTTDRCQEPKQEQHGQRTNAGNDHQSHTDFRG